MNKKLVVIGGIHYPLTMMRYFIEAFEAREDVEVWTYGPFTGNRIPWNNGMTLDQKYVKTPNLVLPESSLGGRIPASFVDIQVPRQADLWLSIDAGWCIDGRPSKAKVLAQIQTDPHVLKDRYRHYRNQYDLLGEQGLAQGGLDPVEGRGELEIEFVHGVYSGGGAPQVPGRRRARSESVVFHRAGRDPVG